MATVREEKIKQGLWKGTYITYSRKKPKKFKYKFSARQKGFKTGLNEYKLIMNIRRK